MMMIYLIVLFSVLYAIATPMYARRVEANTPTLYCYNPKSDSIEIWNGNNHFMIGGNRIPCRQLPPVPIWFGSTDETYWVLTGHISLQSTLALPTKTFRPTVSITLSGERIAA